MSRSKFYLFDTGVLHRLVGRRSLPPGSAEHGAAVETCIAHELHAWRDWHARDLPIRYFRTLDVFTTWRDLAGAVRGRRFEG